MQVMVPNTPSDATMAPDLDTLVDRITRICFSGERQHFFLEKKPKQVR